MTPEEIAGIRRDQQNMLANVEEVEQAYRARPDSVPVDPELEQWLADTRQAISDQQAWLAQLQADVIERRADRRKQMIGIGVLIIVLIAVLLGTR